MNMRNEAWTERRPFGGEDGHVLGADVKIRRRSFINLSVKRGMQWRMMLKIWLIVAFSLTVAGVVFYYYSEMQVGNSYRQFHLRAHEFHDFLLPVLVSGLAASMLLGLVAALFFPQQVAGPLYRIESDLKEIGKGDLTKKVDLRKGDEMVELADAINSMVDQIRGMVRQVDEDVNDLQRIIADATVDVGMKEREELNARCASVRRKIDKFVL